jgi:hypothetical protein
MRTSIIRNLMLGSAALLGAGAALAAPPTGFGGYGNFTVGAADLSTTGGVNFNYDGAGANCPAGYTCASLAASGTGISQRKVTLVDREAAGIVDGNGDLIPGATDIPEGTSFIHTIVVDEGENIQGGVLNGITFLNESFVGAESNSNTIAVLNTVSLTGSVGSGRVTADLSRGFLRQDDEPTDVRVVQTNNSGDGAVTVNFTFLDNGPNSKYQRIDHIGGNGPTNGGSMTIRVSSGDYTCTDTPNPNTGGVPCGDGLIEMPDGNDIAYDDGDALQMVFMRLQNFGTGAAANKVVEVQSVRHAATQGTLYAAPAQIWTSHTDAGVFSTAATSTGSWPFWDGNFDQAPSIDSLTGNTSYP